LETALVRKYAGWCGGTAAMPLPTRLEKDKKKNKAPEERHINNL